MIEVLKLCWSLFVFVDFRLRLEKLVFIVLIKDILMYVFMCLLLILIKCLDVFFM